MMFNSSSSSSKHGNLKEEEDEIAKLLPSQWMQRDNPYYARPTTHTLFPNSIRTEDDVLVKSDEEEKEGDNRVTISNKRMQRQRRRCKRFFNYAANKKRDFNYDLDSEYPDSDDPYWKGRARILQLSKDSIAADGKKKKLIMPEKVDPRPLKERLPIPFFTICENLDAGPPIDGKCRICLKVAHINCPCPYEDFCPIGTHIGDGYIISCKHCNKPLGPVGGKILVESPCCARHEGYAKVRMCFKRVTEEDDKGRL